MSEKAKPGWLPAALDFGPLLIFFLVYKFNAPSDSGDLVGTIAAIVRSTGAFMAAIIVAMVVAKVKLGRISPMMWISAILVLVFGGLTVWLHDARFIQIKPTIIYGIMAAILFTGLARGKPMLKYVLEHGYDGLSDKGWLILSRNWAWFFLAMAVINEILRASVSFDIWLTIKVWGVMIVTVLFAAANVPMLMRHGLGNEEDVPTPIQG